MQRYHRMMMGILVTFGGLMGAAMQMSRAADPPANSASSWTYLKPDSQGLVQGWTQAARDKFYYTSQGSEMMPYDWFLAIEQADTTTLFQENLERFGFIIPPASPKNPDNLPLGFVVDKTNQFFGGVEEQKWVGLTCAACHTAAIDYKKQPDDTAFSTLIIDGGPTMANFGAFINALAPALDATQRDADKYTRFEQRVLGANPAPPAQMKLKQNFTRFAAQFQRYIESSRTLVPWGHGRVDAFGMIFNSVCELDLDQPQNRYSPNAPVSYPFLWNINKQDHIQWHGEVENINKSPLLTPLDRIGRNAGEVMGVFARVEMKPSPLPGYRSSVNLGGLIVLEYEMEKLTPPQWPENILGKINAADKAKGMKLYDTYCLSCHPRITSPAQIVPIKLGQGLYTLKDAGNDPAKDLGTDQNMTLNVHSRKTMQTGWLQGKQPIKGGPPYTATASAQELVNNAVTGALIRLPLQLLHINMPSSQVKTKAADSYKPTARPNSTNVDLTQIGYEARPLHGIWATAPYLHNGSVPNLSQLLLRSKDRVSQFYVGSREYDAAKVGYRSDAGSGGELFDTRLDGNHNTGHEYGTKLLPDQRRQLIEYLKSL